MSSDPLAKVYGLIFKDKKVISKLIDKPDLAGSPNKILREILDVPSTIPVWVENKIRDILESVKEYEGDEKSQKILKALDELGISDQISNIRID